MLVNVNPFDKFLANTLKSTIKDELGLRAYKKIEKRIFEKYGITMIEAIKKFHEIDSILREYFGKGADGIEKKFIENTIKYSKINNKETWITIHNQKLSYFILASFGNPEKKKILEYSFQKPNAITGILKFCEVPKTSGYRITNELIKEGLLVEESFSITKEGKRVGKYISLFDQIKIHMGKNMISVQVLLNNEFLKTSNIVTALGIK